ncbi:MAG: hypothetical protein JXQ69_08130 [Paludibacteraceae bacterium]|nr:hypothetical protein [Paludibacteraceae bacterium]
MKNKVLITALLFVSICSTWAQNKKNIEQDLNTLSAKIPALNNAIDISVNNVSIQDFIRAVAQNATININIEPTIKLNISNDFTQVKVKDILLFLCKEFNLDIEVIGNIISLKKIVPPVEEKKTIPIKIPFVKYEKDKDLLSIDIYNDTLRNVTKEMTDKTGRNIVLAPGISENIVSSYIKSMPFESVLEKFTFSNDLSIEQTKDSFYLIKKKENEISSINSKNNKDEKNNKNEKRSSKENDSNFKFSISNDLISIKAENANLHNLIKTISDELGINYLLLSEIGGNTTIFSENLDYEHFLVKILDGTSYNYMKDGNIFIIGESKNPSLTSTDIYNFQYRSVDRIKDVIPTELTKNVKIIEFTDNNSLIITGDMIGITKLKDFVRLIDKVVPVVLIEITIMDITKYHQFSAGLKLGLGDGADAGAPSKSYGTIYPSLNMELSTNAINSAIKGINGLGLINLGNVSSSFYANLQLMEDNGIVKIKSTPKLATLNGHEASISSGETRYYKEVRSDYIGTQNPSISNSYNWKPLNADLSVTIMPIVSGDGQITLEIQVQQSEFTGRASADEDSPYNSVKRDFKSSIRVKDQEVILLGGLERNKNEDSGNGIPFLSRIPVIKWLFSSRTKTKDSNKLSIFIKPTVIY